MTQTPKSGKHLFSKAKQLFDQGQNVTKSLLADHPHPSLKLDIIRQAYDLQSGSYVQALRNDADIKQKKLIWGKKLGGLLQELGIKSACEAGIGEATTLREVLPFTPDISWSGFDLSLSRLFYAQHWLAETNSQADLFAGNMAEIPLIDNAVEAIVTNHALEPNGGAEDAMLDELLRVASRYVILIEPDYERAQPEQRARMESFGYVTRLAQRLKQRDGKLLRYESWDVDMNPLNAVSLYLFEKQAPQPARFAYASPLTGQELFEQEGYLTHQDDGFLYPIIRKLPYLLEDGAILASHFCKIDPLDKQS